MKAPFILCTHEIDSLRPSAIHLGIIFNSYDSIRVLLDNNIDKTSVCWFDEILIKSKFSVDNKDNGITDNLSTENMFIDYEKIQKRLEGELSEVVSTDKILNSKRSCIDLINEVYKRNVHRLTENMIFRKVAEWKNVLSRYKNGLTVLINARRASYRINYEDIPFDMALDGPSQDPNDISMQNRDEENDDDELASNTNYNTSMGMIQTSRSPTALKLSMQTSKSGGRLSRVSSKKLLRADSSDPFYIPPRTVNRKQLVPKRITRYPWRNHVMVVKLEGKPLLLPRISKETEFLPSRSMSNPNSPSHRKPNTIENIIAASYETNKAKERNNGNVAEDGDVSSEESVEEEKPTYLGKYSYWMESYGQTIAARERELDLLYGTYDSMPYQVSLNRRLNDFDRATGHGKRFGRNEVLDVLVDDNVMDSSSNANSSSNLNTPMASRSHDIHGLKPNEGLTVDIRSPNLASRTLGLSYDSKVNTPKLSTPKRKEMFLKELNVRNEIKYLPRDDDDVY